MQILTMKILVQIQVYEPKINLSVYVSSMKIHVNSNLVFMSHYKYD